MKKILFTAAIIIVSHGNAVPAFSQETLLDSYLGEFANEPGQEELNQPNAPEPQPETQLPAVSTDDNTDSGENNVFENALSEVMGQMNAPDPEPETDALPEIPDLELRLDARGFNNSTGATTVRINVDDLEAQTPEQLEAEIRREAFDAALTGLFPLSEDNIRSLLGKYQDTQKAIEEPLNGVPQPEVTVETVSLDPGVAPMVISTSVGYVTTLNVLDITGAPWPIQDIGWAGNFEIIEPEEGGHIVRITPLGRSAYGNISMRLLTLKTPVTIRLETVPDRVQYRVDARIPEYGPFAETPLIQGGIERVAGNGTIMSILDGVAPSGFERLNVSGVDARTSAFRAGSITYVRTPLTLLSPAWDQSVSSADGMNVYALSDTPVLLLSDNGEFKRAGLSAQETIFDE
ncbi:MAG: DotH/IcmK family type IV secretion protein [Pseudomonadota bacterium]